MKIRILFGLLLLCLVAGLAAVQNSSAASSAATVQRSANWDITGTVIGVGGRFGGQSRPFRLIINQFTTPNEVQRLNSALQSGGQDELLRVLSEMNAGRIQVGNNVGVTANAIIATQQPEGGTKLTVLYRRDINFYELRYGTRSENYRFGFAELYLNRRGRSGEGTFIPAAQVRLREGNVWEVEDFGVFPARLLGLQERGRRVAR